MPKFELEIEEASIDSSLKDDIKAICEYVLEIFAEKISDKTLMEINQLELKKCIPGEGCPWTNVDALPRCYQIYLSSDWAMKDPVGKNECQAEEIVYEFSHEMMRACMFPKDTRLVMPDGSIKYNYNCYSWFIESSCCSIAFICLNEIAKKWKESPINLKRIYRCPDRKSPDFTQFLQRQMPGLIDSWDQAYTWIESDLSGLVATKQVRLPGQLICAAAIMQILAEYPGMWGALCELGNVTKVNDIPCKGIVLNSSIDYNKWRNNVPEEQSPLIDRLEIVFGRYTPSRACQKVRPSFDILDQKWRSWP
ncbi:MAG: hypothetical protein WB392_13405 [Methanotrichaceae archaeon]